MKTTIRDRALGARGLWAGTRVAIVRARRPAVSFIPAAPQTAGTDASPLAVNCIVFSKDRAMQLDLCLRSIERFAPYSGPIVVVYRATTRAFSNGYRALATNGHVRLVEQSDNFRRDVMSAIDPAVMHTVFHTDDDVFFRRPAGTPVLPAGFAAFSLRLGTNTTHYYPLDRPQPVPVSSSQGSVLAWHWVSGTDDFAYPMSLDGHVLSTALLRRMLSRARFANPNQLEEELHLRRYLAPPGMLAFRASSIVSIPANVVSATHRNRAGDNAATSPEALNSCFLAGERIDLGAMDFSAVVGAHQEIPYVFRSART